MIELSMYAHVTIDVVSCTNTVKLLLDRGRQSFGFAGQTNKETIG